MSSNSYKKGLWAESFAKNYLYVKGYSILAQRFKTPLGEVDIIAKRLKTIVFVEVKMRQTLSEAAESINFKNRSRVSNAAELYLQKHPEYNNFEIRFDALVLAPYAWPEHITNAW